MTTPMTVWQRKLMNLRWLLTSVMVFGTIVAFHHYLNHTLRWEDFGFLGFSIITLKAWAISIDYRRTRGDVGK